MTLSAAFVVAAPYLGVLLIGVSKAGFAAGLSLLTTPLLATALPAREAIGLILPLLIACDAVTLAVFWGKWDFRLIRWPLCGCVAGIALGMLCVNAVSDTVLKRCIGALGLTLLVLLVIRNRWYPTHLYRPPPWQGVAVGMLAGFVSTLAHAAGPIMALFLLAHQTEKTVFVATNAIFFALNNLFKLPPYLISGLITQQTLRADLRFLPCIPLGVGIGWLCLRLLPQKKFTAVISVLLLATSVQLLIG